MLSPASATGSTRARRLGAFGLSVRDDPVAVGDLDLEVVGGLVARMIVYREPGRSRIRLSNCVCSVAGRGEAGREAVDRFPEVDRDAAVADRQREAFSLMQRLLRSHRQLLAVAAPAGLLVADFDPLDIESEQVEVEAAEVLSRLRIHLGPAAKVDGGGVVGEVEVVVANVVAAVA